MERGSRSRTRDVLNWLKKKRRRHLKREDLIAFLCDQQAPYRKEERRERPADLTPFRDALLLQRLSGAMSHMGVSQTGSGNDDFQRVLLEDLSRHISDTKKRTAPSSGSDSPNSRKKARFH